MREVIIIKKDEFVGLSVLIAESIVEYSKKFYGFTMVSRQTDNVMCDDAMLGFLSVPIRKALEGEKQ